VSADAAVLAARAAVVNTIGRTCGDAGIFLTGVVTEEPGVYTVSFAYGVAGGWVYLRGGRSAARVTVSGGEASAMVLLFRRYMITDETVTLLPEQLALAAENGEFALGYSDSGGNELIPEWTRVGLAAKQEVGAA
jgi:hypothetical protein